MSWCGGGEISPTPGVECRVSAIHGYTFLAMSWPPSPGLAPWAILIWMSWALVRYRLVTPKRPEATCLMARAALRVQQPVHVLAALARVGLGAQTVHGDGQGLMRLLGDGAVAHGAGGEALDDAADRLDFLQRHGRALTVLEGQQPAERHQVFGLLVNPLRCTS